MIKSVAVVGAGLIGRLAALSLYKIGLKVCLFDKDTKIGGLSSASAAGGLLTPLGESLSCERSIVDMGFASLAKWPSILAELEHPVFFQQQGSVMVAHQQDSGDMLRFNRNVTANFNDYGRQSLDRTALLSLEPQLERFNSGLYLPGEGQIDNRMLLTALQKQLELTEVQWHCGVPVDKVYGHSVDINGQTRHFDLVIDCRGVGASEQISDLRGVRGELFRLYAPEVKLSRPVRLMHPRYQLYIAPKPNDHYIVGATEIESDDDSPMTVRSALELLSAAYSVHSGFSEASIVEHISRCRPAFSNNHPQIRLADGLIQLNGLYRHGFLVAPVALEHLMAVVERLAGAPNIKCDSYLAHFCEGLAFPQLVVMAGKVE